MRKLKIIDLFAGVGGIRLGVENVYGKENVECVLTAEIDKFAKITYQDNFHCENFHTDVLNINEKEIEDFDILLAGFPCQPYSKAGKKLGFKDERGNMFFEIIRILKEKKPPVVFLENVFNLLKHDDGKTFEIMKDELQKLGYHLHYKILNAKDFNTVQGRKRLYIVAFLEDLNFNFPKEIINENLKLKSIFDKDVEEKYTISDKRWEGFKKRKEENKLKGKGFGYQLYTGEERFGATIIARYYKDGSNLIVEQKGKNPRMLSPNEVRRYFGFPEDFKVTVSNSQAYKQFGNSVSVPVIEAIFKEIKKVYKIK